MIKPQSPNPLFAALSICVDFTITSRSDPSPCLVQQRYVLTGHGHGQARGDARERRHWGGPTASHCSRRHGSAHTAAREEVGQGCAAVRLARIRVSFTHTIHIYIRHTPPPNLTLALQPPTSPLNAPQRPTDTTRIWRMCRARRAPSTYWGESYLRWCAS